MAFGQPSKELKDPLKEHVDLVRLGERLERNKKTEEGPSSPAFPFTSPPMSTQKQDLLLMLVFK